MTNGSGNIHLLSESAHIRYRTVQWRFFKDFVACHISSLVLLLVKMTMNLPAGDIFTSVLS